MHASFDTDSGHQAVARLFDLSRAGAVHDIEFNQLDSLVYSRLLQTYAREPDAEPAS
ncbi:MAG TPA: hypothetical protein VIG97_02780 [Luteimonas sp.]